VIRLLFVLDEIGRGVRAHAMRPTTTGFRLASSIRLLLRILIKADSPSSAKRVARGERKLCARFQTVGVTERPCFSYYEEDFSAEFILSKVEGPRNNNQLLMCRGDIDRDAVRIGELELTVLTLGQQFQPNVTFRASRFGR